MSKLPYHLELGRLAQIVLLPNTVLPLGHLAEARREHHVVIADEGDLQK